MEQHPRKGIIYFLSHPIQYFSPLLAELGRTADLDVYYLSDSSVRGGFDKGFGRQTKWDTPLLEGYRYHFLHTKSSGRHPDNKFFDSWNFSVFRIARKSRAAIIIVNGWAYGSNWIAVLGAKLSGKQVWLRAENPLNQELRKRPVVRVVKKIFLRHLFFRFLVDRFLYIGTESKQFFRYYGVPEHKLIYTPYAIDNAHFHACYLREKTRKDQLRTELGLPAGKKIILFTGKYIAKKRPLDLLRAFHLLPREQYALVMVGEGDLRPAMEEYITANALQHVFLTGFVNQSKISAYYSVCDVFVMCSGMGETWGLAVNEAMNFAKPLLVCRTCGCATDLVRDGANGFVFEEGDVTALSKGLLRVLCDEEFSLSAGKLSATIVQDFSNAAIVHNIMTALDE